MARRVIAPVWLDGAPRAGRAGRASRRVVLLEMEQAVRCGGGAVIFGEAGIGKSFAARAVAARLGARGATVEFVLATEAAPTPSA
jgi:MoxR-like ATPase